jgi:probable HAF family extracellular repeat protein
MMRITSRTRCGLSAVLFLAIGPLAPEVSADALYQVTNLGSINVVGLTDAGQVVQNYYGTSNPYNGPTPLLYSSYGPSAGQQTPLPLTSVTAVSPNGTVSGYGLYPGSPSDQAVVYNVNTPSSPPIPIQTNLGPANILGDALVTAGVNDSGQTVGSAPVLPANYVPGGPAFTPNQHAFLSNGSTITDLGTLSVQESAATAINNAGQIVGNVGTSGGFTSGITHAFLYTAGKMIDLGGLPGYTYTSATAINSSGQVVGTGENTNGSSGAFLYSNGHMTNLGTLPGDTSAYASAINSQGVIVGSSWHIGPANLNNALNNNAFIDQNGVMTNLNSLIPASSGIHLQDARAINSAGQILVYGVDSFLNGQAYLLTPSNMMAPVAPVLFGSEVPEPSTLAFVILLGAVAGAKWGYSRLGRVATS